MILSVFALLGIPAVISVRFWYKKSKGRGVSILVPFNGIDEHDQRVKNWKWLKKYWRTNLPGAEIVMGRDCVSEEDPGVPFSKAVAVNDAASRAKGDIFVVADADCYISIEVVMTAVQRIRHEEQKGRRLWFVPYRHFFRLTEEASQLVLNSKPNDPYVFSTPPPLEDVQDTSGSLLGHWYGAMIQILSRNAFYEVGGWDPRFRGWGGEDHAAMRATDTLYWKHKTLPNQVLHIWHPMHTPSGTTSWADWRSRIWVNQTTAGVNDKLSGRYYGAHGDVKRMRKLVEEGKNHF